MTISVNETLTTLTKASLLSGKFPVEFHNRNGAINEDSAPDWAAQILAAARLQLAQHLASGGASDKKSSPDIYVFTMKHKYPLTQSMDEAGWEQWQSTIATRTKEECAAEGVKYKRFRYACHFWVSPEGCLALGKLKTQGKHIPD